MTFEIVFVLLSLLGMMAALIADKMRPGMVLFSVVVLFLCVGILTPYNQINPYSLSCPSLTIHGGDWQITLQVSL